MQKTNINYLTHTYNPIVMRCSRVSPACDNCWHIAYCDRHQNNMSLPAKRRQVYWGEKLYLDEQELTAPIRIRKPAIIGTQFMGDLFKKDVPDEMIDRVMAVIALCPQHKFIVLTKRAERLTGYFTESEPVRSFYLETDVRCRVKTMQRAIWETGTRAKSQWNGVWPLPNLCVGVTVENQEWADKRIPTLLQIPAAKHIISYEPALGPVDWSKWFLPKFKHITGLYTGEAEPFIKPDLVIIGCESGPNRRETKLEWAESAVEQCKSAGVKVWIKQLEINGKVTTDINQFPKHLQIRERP